MRRCDNRIGRVDGASCSVQARARSANTINTPSTGTGTTTTTTTTTNTTNTTNTTTTTTIHTISCLLLQLLRQCSTPLLQLLAALNPDVNVKVPCPHATATAAVHPTPHRAGDRGCRRLRGAASLRPGVVPCRRRVPARERSKVLLLLVLLLVLVLLLLTHVPSINATCSGGFTALHIAGECPSKHTTLSIRF
jgi:hypothetical protein